MGFQIKNDDQILQNVLKTARTNIKNAIEADIEKFKKELLIKIEEEAYRDIKYYE